MRIRNLKTIWVLLRVVLTSKRYTIFAISEEGDDAEFTMAYEGLKGEVPIKYLKEAVEGFERHAYTVKEISEMTATATGQGE